jgi:lysine decarboxylase
LGISGFQVLHLIREQFNIQLELAEISEVLAVVGIGTTDKDIDILIKAFKSLSDQYYSKDIKYTVPHFHYDYPQLIVRPREAFYAPSKTVQMKDAVGEISAESIMIYPPGIPIAIPGEIISQDALDLVKFYQENDGVLLSDSPEGYIKVIDQSIWYKGGDIDYEY